MLEPVALEDGFELEGAGTTDVVGIAVPELVTVVEIVELESRCELEGTGTTDVVGIAVPELVTVVEIVELEAGCDSVELPRVVVDDTPRFVLCFDGLTVVVAPELGCVLEQAGITVLVREAVPERVTVV